MPYSSYVKYTYQLVVLAGMDMNDSVTPLLTIDAQDPPIFVNPIDLGGADAAGKIFTMGVRIKSDQVH